METDKNTVIKLSEKLRLDIEKHVFEAIEKVTISVGATTYRDGDDNDLIVKRADTALYVAKNAGKNCVNFF